ncbi:MAG TPA: GNAT family N-acetyltransferase [Gemmataceae bacterium]|nr:GNAT family N-acetyltransferase [Gemmataceae bacterium]
MRVISLHRPDEIEPILRQNVFLNIYALGDLDPAFWPFTTWYALEDGGSIRAILLLYTAFETPTLIALADPPYDALHELLRSARRMLPAKMYSHLSPGALAAFGPNTIAESRGPHRKMALFEPALVVPQSASAERMTDDDVPELTALYDCAYPNHWFDPWQIATGQYFGLRINGLLVSAAGCHVYSPAQRVAALGNIVTHPDHRGHGYAAAITARLCTEVLKTVDYVGLNVKADNSAAIRCYERLGFRKVAKYEEVAITLL